MTISQNVTAIGLNQSTYFSVSGGTGPYTWTAVNGSFTGAVYTAANTQGVDTITVTDSLAATATTTLTVMNALELVCDIIQTYMGLSNGQVYLWDQKVDFPKDSQLYIVVGIISCKPFANTNIWDGTNQNQSVNMNALLSINIFSRSTAARDQKEQILFALKSTYAEQQMEANGFFIAPITSGFQNVSDADGPAILYQFNLSANLQYVVSQKSTVPYFSTFTKSVATNP